MLRRRRQQSSFVCVTCGDTHEGAPRAYVVGTEPPGWAVTRDPSSHLWGEVYEEQAILHGSDGPTGFFIRSNLEIPVQDRGAPLAFTVWVSISETNFERAASRWDEPERASEPPYFAWFSAAIPTYPAAVQLKAIVHSRAPGLRSLLELEPTEHELAVDQRHGVTETKVREIAAAALHGAA